MDLEKLAFQLDRAPPAYCQMFKDLQDERKRQQKYNQIKQKMQKQADRKPTHIIKQIQNNMKEIFKLDLAQIKKEVLRANPEFDEQMISRETDLIYLNKIKSMKMIDGDPLVLEELNIPIENKRKLKTERQSMNSSKKKTYSQIDQKSKPPNTQRQKQDATIQPTELSVFALQEKLNTLLEQQIQKQGKNYKRLDIILEDDIEDLINKPYQQVNVLKFKNQQYLDLPSELRPEEILRFEVLDTGRTEIEQLQGMLKNLLGEQLGFSSRRTIRNLKIRKEVLNNLYDFQGKLKLDLIKRVLDKVKK